MAVAEHLGHYLFFLSIVISVWGFFFCHQSECTSILRLFFCLCCTSSEWILHWKLSSDEETLWVVSCPSSHDIEIVYIYHILLILQRNPTMQWFLKKMTRLQDRENSRLKCLHQSEICIKGRVKGMSNPRPKMKASNYPAPNIKSYFGYI